MVFTHLTQTHLELLDRCPRRLQYTYLDQLTAPVDPTVLERQEWGKQVHRVLQQYQLGLPPQPLLDQQPDLKAAVEGVLTTAPQLFSSPGGDPGRCLSEHQRT
ncbi:MAG: PD-(D/E)XK nuclease family protein, partial [Nodosilinea sp.]